TAVLLVPVLPRTRALHARVDYLGAALLVGGVTAVLLGLVWGGVERPWGSATVIGLLVGGGALLALLVLRAGRVPAPIIPVRLFRDRTFALAGGAGFCIGACLFGAIYYVPLLLQAAQHRSAS